MRLALLGLEAMPRPIGLAFAAQALLRCLKQGPAAAASSIVNVQGALLRLAACAFIAILTACGGGGSSPPPPTPTEILTQPASISVPAGSNAAFSVSARGDALSYQWQSSSNGGTAWTDIAGATASSYTRNAVSVADNGLQLRVQVRGSAGSVTSSAATLTVSALAAPTIVTQPADQSVPAGGRAAFSVTATGTSPTYRWQRSNDGGSTYADVAGATAATLTLDPVALPDNGARLRVIVANAAGSVTSSAALLTVTAPPIAPTITTQPAAASVVAPQPATFTVVATGTAPLAYQWQRSNDGGSIYADVSGATAASLTIDPTAVSDNGALLRVRITNGVGSVTSPAVLLTVSAATSAPVFTQVPQPQTVTAPAAATFSVTVSGTPTPTLQWQVSSDGGVTFVNIVGATSTSYSTPATSLADNIKLFRAVASNASGSITSSAAPLYLTGVLGLPYAISVDASGNLAFSVLPNAQTGTNTFAGLIQFRSAIGAIGSLAGGPVQGFVNGTGAGARFLAPLGMTYDTSGDLFVSEIGNHVIRRISPAGVVTTFAGTGATGFQDGPRTSATFGAPYGLAFDPSGQLFIADQGWNTIRRVGTDGVVATLAGLVDTPGFIDGSGTAARLDNPTGLAVDSAGNVVIADLGNHAIRRMTAAGIVTTLAGGGTGSAGLSGFADATGRAARFNSPRGIAVDGGGNVYVADTSNHSIRKITPAGVVTTLAGNGTSGFQDGTGAAARFSGPQGVAVDAAGNVYVADTGNRAIRRITPAGAVSTLLQ